MADSDIQKYKNLLKRLDEEMIFLRSLMAQALVVSSNLKVTWSSIDKIHKGMKNEGKTEEKV